MSADFTGGGGTLAQSPLAGPSPPESALMSGSTLEPLPETEGTSRRSPRRDWKPPLREDQDVVGAMEAIEGIRVDSSLSSGWMKSNVLVLEFRTDASAKDRVAPWRRTAVTPEVSQAEPEGYRSRFRRMRSRNQVEEAAAPPADDERMKRKAMIGSLGRQGVAPDDKLTIYIKQDDPSAKDSPAEPQPSHRRTSGATEGSGVASRLLDRYRQQTAMQDAVVPNDLLRTLEEADRKETYDRAPAPLPPPTASSLQAANNAQLSAAERDKKRYQRTMVSQSILLIRSIPEEVKNFSDGSV